MIRSTMDVPLIIVTLTTGSLLGTYAGNFQTQYEWKYFDYVWPSAAKKSEAIRTGAYNHSMIMPIDVDVAQDGRVFVTLLQLPGVPARMGYVSTQKSPSGPLIQPYPNWEWFGNGDCDNSIEKVLRVEIDKCNRLWVLDTGSKKNPKRNCSAKLLAFDLNTDTLISRVNFPDDIARNPRTIESLMATTVVETYGQNCEDTTVYMAECYGSALITWDGKLLARLESATFMPNLYEARVTAGNSTETVDVGIVGMSLSPRIYPNEPRLLYFRPIASYGLYSMNVDDIKNAVGGQPATVLGIDDLLSSQSIGQAFSSQGTLFLGLTKELSIACWNRYTELKKENIKIVARDPKRLQYATGMKVLSRPFLQEEELWVITNRFPAFSQGHLNFKESNYFILRSTVRDLIAGTRCELPQGITDYGITKLKAIY